MEKSREEGKSREELIAALYEAKKAEEAAHEARVAAEEALVAALDEVELGTSKTFSTETLKVTVERGVKYEVDDYEAFEAAWPDFVKTKTTVKKELDAKKYEAARTAGAAEWRDMAAHVAVKLLKPSVTLRA